MDGGEIARAADAARLEHAYRRSILRATTTTTTTSSEEEDGGDSLEEARDAGPQLDDERAAARPRRRPTEGYVTLDPPGCGGADDDDDDDAADERFGDDTLHRPFKSSWQPIFVATDFPPPPPLASSAGQEENRVDVVFLDFIKPDILSALNVLSAAERGPEHAGGPWTEEDVEVYLEGITANTLMEEYAKRYWQQ